MASEIDHRPAAGLRDIASGVAASVPPWAVLTGDSSRVRGAGGGSSRPLFDDDDNGSGSSSSSRVASPISSPPYWLHAHHRAASTTSVESVLPAGAITLQDNEYDDGPNGSNVYGRDRNRACWAKSVEVTDYVVVNGSATNIGAFVVWNIRVETLSVSISSSTAASNAS
jgi:hypothetical protein